VGSWASAGPKEGQPREDSKGGGWRRWQGGYEGGRIALLFSLCEYMVRSLELSQPLRQPSLLIFKKPLVISPIGCFFLLSSVIFPSELLSPPYSSLCLIMSRV
jgi:hypothetical protein